MGEGPLFTRDHCHDVHSNYVPYCYPSRLLKENFSSSKNDHHGVPRNSECCNSWLPLTISPRLESIASKPTNVFLLFPLTSKSHSFNTRWGIKLIVFILANKKKIPFCLLGSKPRKMTLSPKWVNGRSRGQQTMALGQIQPFNNICMACKLGFFFFLFNFKE